MYIHTHMHTHTEYLCVYVYIYVYVYMYPLDSGHAVGVRSEASGQDFGTCKHAKASHQPRSPATTKMKEPDSEIPGSGFWNLPAIGSLL